MRKQEFILNELRAIAADISDVVEDEIKDMEEHRRLLEREKMKPQQPIPGRLQTTIKPELRYVMARLDTVMRYLEDDILGTHTQV